MNNLISRTVAFIGSLFAGFQLKQMMSAVLIGFLLLASNVQPEVGNPAVTKAVKDIVHQNDSDRPKTVGEWQKEARETEGGTGERAERIAKESAEAVKDWSGLYPDTAERSGDAVKEDTRQAGRDLMGNMKR